MKTFTAAIVAVAAALTIAAYALDVPVSAGPVGPLSSDRSF